MRHTRNDVRATFPRVVTAGAGTVVLAHIHGIVTEQASFVVSGSTGAGATSCRRRIETQSRATPEREFMLSLLLTLLILSVLRLREPLLLLQLLLIRQCGKILLTLGRMQLLRVACSHLLVLQGLSLRLLNEVPSDCWVEVERRRLSLLLCCYRKSRLGVV